MIRAAALWLHFVEVERPEVAGTRLMLVPIAVFQRAESGVVGKGLLTTTKEAVRAQKWLF
jgi:hypothetical protein